MNHRLPPRDWHSVSSTKSTGSPTNCVKEFEKSLKIRMKEEETIRFAKGLSKEEFNSVEPQLAYLNKYLTLRSYVDGYTQSQADSTLWVAIRGQQGCARLRVNKAHLVNLCRWFTFVEQSHPELQEEIVREGRRSKGGEGCSE